MTVFHILVVRDSAPHCDALRFHEDKLGIFNVDRFVVSDSAPRFDALMFHEDSIGRFNVDRFPYIVAVRYSVPSCDALRLQEVQR